jgi:NADH:quinone reductase (non-electrogenic)
VLVVGTGFAGFHCLRALERHLPADAAELVAVNPSDYMLYVPLLPEVAGGVLDPRRVAVPLRLRLPRTRLILGEATGVDVAGRTCTVIDVEGRLRTFDWDRLVIACGAVTRLLSIPGVAAYAKGFKNIAEALYLRDHILREIELADLADDPVERRARTTFVVVGAGYTGTELAAQCQLLTRAALRRHRGMPETEARVLLLDLADRVLPGLNARLAGPAERALRRRGIDVRLRTSVTEVTPTCVRLSSGDEVPTRTVVWCVGVRPDPLVEALGLPTRNGRLVVDEWLSVPGQGGIFAAGDAAAVPDPAHPGEITAMTGQHAQRQGKVAAGGIAASLGFGQARPYRHRELGFVVDLGGWQAVADPFHVPITGPPARLLACVFHLVTLPGGRLRVATDWMNEAVADRQIVHLGLVPEGGVTLAATDRLPSG